MTKIFIWLSRVSLKKVKREIFDFFELLRPRPEWCCYWGPTLRGSSHHSLYLSPKLAHFAVTVMAGGWKPIRSIFMHISPWPSSVPDSGLAWVCLQLQSLNWPDIGMCYVLLLAPPRPVLVTGVKSVQINFMILTAHNARQRTGKILATILPIWEDNSQEGPRAILIKRMKCGGWVIISRVSHNEHLWSLFHDPNTFFIWPIFLRGHIHWMIYEG